MVIYSNNFLLKIESKLEININRGEEYTKNNKNNSTLRDSNSR